MTRVEIGLEQLLNQFAKGRAGINAATSSKYADKLGIDLAETQAKPWSGRSR